MSKKRKLKVWTQEEYVEVKAFFSLPKSREEKDAFAKKLDRTYPSIYNKHWSLANPEKHNAARNRMKLLKTAKKDIEQNNSEFVKVTHVNKTIAPLVTTIKIGKCVIETYSSKIKIDDVLIEV
tara:strand:- start:686 stop:1054 length:369 start_codon:yes stop_codon:yes gene_type:complete